MKMRKRTVIVSSNLMLCLVFLSVADAQIGDTIHPYAYARVLQDDNLFRVNTNEEKDTLTALGAGVDALLILSRQRINLGAQFERATYDKADNLDHKNMNLNGNLNWVVGSDWRGRFGVKYRETIASFNETATIRSRDDRATLTSQGSAGYSFSPRWDIIGSMRTARLRIDNRLNSDFDRFGYSTELRYATGAKTKVGVKIGITNVDFENDTIIGSDTISSDFSNRVLSGTFSWEGSSKSKLDARIGWTDVEHDELTDRDFSGQSSRINYLWQTTAKSQLKFSLWREATTRFEVDSLVISQGVSIRPRWNITSKLSSSMMLRYNKLDFRGDANASLLGGVSREDTINSISLALGYQISRVIKLDFRFITHDRDSNVPIQEYSYNTYRLGIRARL
ncbi:hypothetical protein MNBD_GAMMA16-442 [hydrothermal vent metagenome]|uniref:Outer membrane beta-barrel protein n=1 Tax=hydrothermal vent metagenome TaxID=652676 RepID=A0A3B0Z4J7_9ZZZZ